MQRKKRKSAFPRLEPNLLFGLKFHRKISVSDISLPYDQPDEAPSTGSMKVLAESDWPLESDSTLPTQQLNHFDLQPWHVVLDDPPDGGLVHDFVAVNQAVPKCNDLGSLTDPVEGWRIQPEDSTDRFSNDLELAFDGCSKQLVVLEVCPLFRPK